MIRLRMLWIVPLLLLVSPGCSKADLAPPQMAAPTAEEAKPGEPPPAPPADPSGSVAVPASTAPPAPPRERLLLRVATVALEVARYQDAAEALRLHAEVAGGFVVSSSDRVDSSNKVRSGTVVLRVPSAAFDSTLDQIRKTATTVESVEISTSDVTEEFVDVEARLRSKGALEQRYVEILGRAASVREALEVEQALAGVREEVERIEGRRRYLADRAALSTFTVQLHEPYPALAAQGGGVLATLAEAFSVGADALVRVLYGLIVAAIATSPLLFLLVVSLLLLRIWLKRRARRAGAPRVSPGAPSGTTP